MRKRQCIMRCGARIIEFKPHRMRERWWNDYKKRHGGNIRKFNDNWG